MQDEQLQCQQFERSGDEDASLGIYASTDSAPAMPATTTTTASCENPAPAPPPPKQPRLRLAFSNAEAEASGLGRAVAAPEGECEPHDRLFEFQASCPRCAQRLGSGSDFCMYSYNAPAPALSTLVSLCSARSVETRMTMLSIPHFGQVLLMATACERCGFREKEVKCTPSRFYSSFGIGRPPDQPH